MKIKILKTQIERKNQLKKQIDPSEMNCMSPHTTVKHHVGLINLIVGLKNSTKLNFSSRNQHISYFPNYKVNA
ncbi:hypothetical protein PAHAL_1G282300 [Panicum hallii]|jgi:hypothetical protein|uniref:Uncharacterized protein n=1 Tax=Panicum hallii TaxID=206008 RepID=A0A2T8KWL6_9POAL|nr:hypothetical protein PAHAL_1G282300 [Panicum hallii]